MNYGCVLLVVVLSWLCYLWLCFSKRTNKAPPRRAPVYTEYPGDRIDKASLQSYEYGQGPYNGAPQRLMFASEMVYDNSAYKGAGAWA